MFIKYNIKMVLLLFIDMFIHMLNIDNNIIKKDLRNEVNYEEN